MRVCVRACEQPCVRLHNLFCFVSDANCPVCRHHDDVSRQHVLGWAGRQQHRHNQQERLENGLSGGRQRAKEPGHIGQSKISLYRCGEECGCAESVSDMLLTLTSQKLSKTKM